MSYPTQCYAGFPNPLMVGKFEITGFSATVKTPASTSQLAIFDDARLGNALFGRTIPLADIFNTKTLIADVKTVAATDGYICYEFAEPIKIRYGISIAADNIEGGSICLYRR